MRVLAIGLCLVLAACGVSRRSLPYVEATIVLDVTVDEDGDVTQVVVKSENPPGVGFGEIAARDMRNRAEFPAGEPGTIEVVVRYLPDESQPCRRASASGTSIKCGGS